MKRLILILFVFVAVSCGDDTDSKSPNSANNQNNTANNINNQNNQNDAGNNTGSDMDSPVGQDLMVTGMVVTPSSILAADTGMTDEFITVTIGYIGADSLDEEDSTVGWVDEFGGLVAEVNPVSQSDGEIVFSMPYSAFSGVEPGEYDIGADLHVANSTYSLFVAGRVTLTVTE